MSERVRVYHLITGLEPAGAERVLYEIARGLDPDRYQVRVGSLVAGGSVGVWLRAAGIEVFELGMTRGGWRAAGLPRALVRLVRDLRAFRPRILHTHLFHAGALGRLASLAMGRERPQVVSHVHIVEGRPLPWRDRFDRLTSRLVAREVCVSRAVAASRQARNRIPADRLVVIPNGVDLERARQQEVVTRMKTVTRLRAGRRTVLAIGRLDRQKGLDVLVAAVPRIRESFPDLQLFILGEGRERPALETQIARLELGTWVTLAGYREDIGRFLAAAEVLAMPSRWEGFGITAVEAMAAGVPVVASNVDSLPELVEEGVTGLLVPADDPGALADAIVGLLADSETRARMSEAGRKAAEAYSVEAMVRRCEELYDELLGFAAPSPGG